MYKQLDLLYIPPTSKVRIMKLSYPHAFAGAPKVFLTLFFRGFVPFLSLADFVSRDKNLQVVDLQRLKSCLGELVTAATSNCP